jgi:hypothetical protein
MSEYEKEYILPNGNSAALLVSCEYLSEERKASMWEAYRRGISKVTLVTHHVINYGDLRKLLQVEGMDDGAIAEQTFEIFFEAYPQNRPEGKCISIWR